MLTVMVVAVVSFLLLGDNSGIARMRRSDLLYAAGTALAMAVDLNQPCKTSNVNEHCRFLGQAMIISAVLAYVWSFATDTTIIHGAFGVETASQSVYLAPIGSAANFLGLEWLLRRWKAWFVAQGCILFPTLATVMNAATRCLQPRLKTIPSTTLITVSLYFSGRLSARKPRSPANQYE